MELWVSAGLAECHSRQQWSTYVEGLLAKQLAFPFFEFWDAISSYSVKSLTTALTLTIGPHNRLVVVLTNGARDASFYALGMLASRACSAPCTPPLPLSVITTTPLAALQCCHHSQSFRQITRESDPLPSIMALRRVLQVREVCYGCRLFQGFHRSQIVQL